MYKMNSSMHAHIELCFYFIHVHATSQVALSFCLVSGEAIVHGLFDHGSCNMGVIFSDSFLGPPLSVTKP